MVTSALLPPSCPEAERGILGCCLLDISKVAVALKAGVTVRWFYELRHKELFSVLSGMALNGGGDFVVATLLLRERGKLEGVGGIEYLTELQNGVPSAENIEYYIPELQDYFRRRQVLDATSRLQLLARDPLADSASVLTDTESVLEWLHHQADTHALPEIISAKEFLEMPMEKPKELVTGLIHQGSKLIVGGSSKSYKTWALVDLAISVSTGSPWLGFPTSAGKVLYVNLEIQAPFFRDRLKYILEAGHLELNNNLDIWNLRGYVTDYRTLVPQLRNRIKDEGFALVIVDPTYKLLGIADENSASDIAGLLNAMENLAVTTGAAVAMAGHFAKGNAAAKESIDRISGSGVFARDPDSLITFTKHEEEGAFTVEMTLRDLPPVEAFVVKWQWPLFRRAENLDPTRLKQTGGRPTRHTPEAVLECLGNQRLSSTEWRDAAQAEGGISNGKFYDLKNVLKDAGKVQKSVIDGKWEKIQHHSRNSNYDKDQ